MTLVLPDRAGIDRLLQRLDAGVPIIVPLPSPLPYVVVGTDAAQVNAAKRRPPEQPVGVGMLSLEAIEPAVALEPDAVALVRWLLLVEGVGVLVPVDAAAPPWLAPATVDGMAFLGGVWLPQLAELMAGRTHVYMSSGNVTSSEPAVTAAEAEAAFGPEMLVADGDALRDSRVAHGSSTMVAVGRVGSPTVARPGINNRRFGDDDGVYVDDLLRRWREAGAATREKTAGLSPAGPPRG